MKTLIYALLLFLPFMACSDNNGCRDAGALNYDPNADSDGPCQFTRVIFYAGSNRVGGTADRVEKIEIYERIILEEQFIGEITDLDEVNPSPEGCTPPVNSVVVTFNFGHQSRRFFTRFYYEGGASEAGDSYEFAPESKTECIVQNLTL